MKKNYLEESLLCDIFKKFSGLSFIKNKNSQFIFVNDRWSQTIGYSKEEVLGRTSIESLTDDLKNQFLAMDEAVLISGEEQILVERINKNNGSLLTIRTRKNLYVSDEGESFIIGIVEDITEIEEGRKALEEINRALQKSNKEKDMFFSIIAHDLRGPFNGFLGLTEYMSDNIESMSIKEISEYVLLLKNSAINFHNSLENLLKWALLQREMTHFIPATTNLKIIADSNIGLILIKANEKWIEIINEIPEDLFVFADKNMLHSIFINLITNAIKFTPKRGSIHISAKGLPNNFVQISINDTGLGMSESITNDLFNISTKVTSNHGTEGEQGTGLGLILCKDFVEKHGGKIWVESEQNVGSTFYFSLPTN